MYLHITPQDPRSRLTVPSGIRCSNHSLASVPSIYSRCWRQSKTKWNGRLKCSADDFREQSYGDDHYNQFPLACPKPLEIPWNKELCNSVSLIGIVATPVETKQFPSGKVTAWTRLAVRKNATQTSWIHLTFWDELAHVAFQHLEKGHQIHVSGRLVTDTVESDDGKQNTYYKVLCQQLNFIERSSLSSSSYDLESDTMISGKSCMLNNLISMISRWSFDKEKISTAAVVLFIIDYITSPLSVPFWYQSLVPERGNRLKNVRGSEIQREAKQRFTALTKHALQDIFQPKRRLHRAQEVGKPWNSVFR